MKRTAYQPPDVFVPAGKTYSHGIIVEGAAKTLYVAGQTSRDRDGKVVCVGDAAGQTRQVLENMKRVIEGAGGRITDWRGNGLKMGSGDRVIATGDARVHDEALAILAA